MTYAYLLTPNHETRNIDLQTVNFHGGDIVEAIKEILGCGEIDVAYGRNRLDKHIVYSSHDATLDQSPGFTFLEDISDTAIPGRLIVMGVVQSGDSSMVISPTAPVAEMVEMCSHAYGELKLARAMVNFLDAMTSRYK